MISDFRCFFCLTRSFEKLLEKEDISNDAKTSFTYDLTGLYQSTRGKYVAPEFTREIHNLLRGYTMNPDPYKNEKRENNDHAISMIPELKRILEMSEHPFDTALRLAIAGNIIDFAANDNFNLKATIEQSLVSKFAIDHSKKLKKALESAATVLYLGDNAGEIVFDKLFIETIMHPNLIYVVRGSPVINDATMEDAEYVGMKNVAMVISNEYDAPSTIVHKSGSLFREYFKKADLIISKGQGNLEGLMPLNDDRIFYLLMVKCFVIAEFLKVKKDSLVVFNPVSERVN